MRLLRYVRSGGPPPGEDEWLEVEDDGTFTLERCVGRGRIGAFAGTLDQGAFAELAELAGLVSDVAAGSTGEPTDDGGPLRRPEERPRLEILRTPLASTTLTYDDLDGAWEPLRQRSRALVSELTSDPVAALELRLSDDAARLTLEAVGRLPVEVRNGSSSVAVTLFDRDDEWVGSAGAPFDWPGTSSEPVRLDPGWTMEGPLVHGLERTAGDALSAELTFDVAQPRGGWRLARLSAVSGPGWDGA